MKLFISLKKDENQKVNVNLIWKSLDKVRTCFHVRSISQDLVSDYSKSKIQKAYSLGKLWINPQLCK